MFRADLPSIIRGVSLHTQQWYMSYGMLTACGQAQDGRNSFLILLASCQQACVTYTIAVRTVKNSW